MLESIMNVFRAMLAPVIAAVVAYIAYQQYKTNRDKLRFDLYDRRLKVFEGLMKMLGYFKQKGKIEPEQVDEFLKESREDVFLFDKDIVSYLETVRKNALDLWATNEELKDIPRGEEKNKKARERTDLLHWLANQFDVATEKFSKYLKFEQRLKGNPLNLKRGVNRIALVLSVLWFLFWSMVGISEICDYGWESDTWIIFPFIFLSPIVVWLTVWVVYYTGLFIVRGFRDDRLKDEQNNK